MIWISLDFPFPEPTYDSYVSYPTHRNKIEVVTHKSFPVMIYYCPNCDKEICVTHMLLPSNPFYVIHDASKEQFEVR